MMPLSRSARIRVICGSSFRAFPKPLHAGGHMALKLTKVEVWAGEIQDQPGGVAKVLRAVADAGGSLECVIARREQSRPGTGVVFVTPVKGKRVQDAARRAGLSPAADIATLRVEGPDQPGVGAAMMEALAAAGINVRGVSAVALGRSAVCYIGLDSVADADAAANALKRLGGAARGKRPPAGGARRKRTTKRAATRRR